MPGSLTMTRHYAVLQVTPGETATAKTFDRYGVSDTVIKTSAPTGDKANDKGTYVFEFTDVTAGIYTIKPFGADGSALAGSSLVSFLGVDEEIGRVYPLGSDGPLQLDPDTPRILPIVTRSDNDTEEITFNWPTDSATITGQVSINNGAYANLVGARAFLRSESGIHWYTLAYNAADRPTAEGSARYKMTDGTYTRYFNLQVTPSSGTTFEQEAF